MGDHSLSSQQCLVYHLKHIIYESVSFGFYLGGGGGTKSNPPSKKKQQQKNNLLSEQNVAAILCGLIEKVQTHKMLTISCSPSKKSSNILSRQNVAAILFRQNLAAIFCPGGMWLDKCHSSLEPNLAYFFGFSQLKIENK